MEEKLDNYFNIFMELYRENQVRISLRKNSYAVSFDDEPIDRIDNKKEFRDFVSKLFNTLRRKVLRLKIDEGHDMYEKYVDSLLEHDPEIRADIITRCMSNINICNNISYEILTKRNEDLEVECYSLLVNLNLEKPNLGKDILEQINFELSIKDLRLLHRNLEEAIGEIEKLNKKSLEC